MDALPFLETLALAVLIILLGLIRSSLRQKLHHILQTLRLTTTSPSTSLRQQQEQVSISDIVLPDSSRVKPQAQLKDSSRVPIKEEKCPIAAGIDAEGVPSVVEDGST